MNTTAKEDKLIAKDDKYGWGTMPVGNKIPATTGNITTLYMNAYAKLIFIILFEFLIKLNNVIIWLRS